MKKNYAVRTALGLAALSLAVAAHAQMSASDMIKARQSGFTFMAWNMGKIKAQVVDGTVPYDRNQVAAAADAIAAIANSGMGALFAPGTDKGTGWKATRLQSNFFDEPDKTRELATNWIQEANQLKKTAADGDQAAIARQFGELGKACKACHDNYRAEE